MARSLKQFMYDVFLKGTPEKSKVFQDGYDTTGRSSNSTQRQVGSNLSPEMCRKIALLEPLTLKGIRKKNKDTFRNWLILRSEKEDKPVEEKVLKLIREFDKRTLFPHKLYESGICSNIYGDGFIEQTFIEANGKKSYDKVNWSNKPLGLNILDSERITKMDYKDSKDKQLYYIYDDKKGKKTFIHPDRLIHIKIDKLPFSNFGLSKIDTLSKTLTSKLSADESTGEILNWFGHGILFMKIQNMNPEQKKKAIEHFKTHPDYYVGDQDYELEVKNPTTLRPKEFYDYFYVNIGAALEMPQHILTGISPGNVTGSETGVADYYHDVENIQNMVFTPIIESVYKHLLESHGLKWKYNIVWNPIFLDELAEAKILEKRTLCATQSFAHNLIDVEEGRRILNEGVINLDTKKKPKKEETPAVPPMTPNVEPQKPPEKEEEKKETKYITLKPLTIAQNEMIRRMKEYGKKEELAQEERIKQANELAKKKRYTRKKKRNAN